MECVERALKSGLRREVAAKAIQNQGMVVDDLWAVTSGQAGVDEFFVDEFLDLSNGDDDNDNIVVEPVPEPEPEPKPKPKQQEEEEEEEEEEDDENEFQHVPKKEQPTGNCNSSKHNFPSLSPTELTVPADDLGDLEWLSHFVEDSFTETEYSLLTYPTGNLPTTQSKDDCTQNRSGSQPHPHPHPPNPCFNPPVPAKARTKRARTGGRVWSLGSPSADTSSTSSSSTSSSTSSSPSSALLIYSHSPAGVGPMGGSSSLASANKPPAAKKQRKKKSGSASDAHAPPPPPRRCSHCHVQKTPQWRTGPLGAKTLCNACGVRFKSGRLLPEYRPACSPTFSSDLHSNNHRKVLEMRRKKETTELSESGVASAAGAVQSF